MTLPASIEEPPPTGTTTVPSIPNASNAAEPAATVVVPGFGSTPSKMVDSMPAVERTPTTRPATPDRTTPGSVTTNARDAPTSWARPGSVASEPTPKRTRPRSCNSMARSASVVIGGSFAVVACRTGS